MVQGRAGMLISFLLAVLPSSLRGHSVTSEIINVTGAAFPTHHAE